MLLRSVFCIEINGTHTAIEQLGDNMNKHKKHIAEKAKKEKIKETSNQVLETSGGEMPDPPKMPSSTKFNVDQKKNVK